MKIAIVEYKNIVSSNHQPLGHGIKVLNEAIELCNANNYDVKIIAAQSYIDSVRYDCKKEVIPFDFVEGDSSPYIFFKWYINISRAIMSANNCDVIWFTNVDWRVFLFFGLHPLYKKNMVLTEYTDSKKYISSLGKNRGFLGQLVRKICYRGYDKYSFYIQTYNKDYHNDKYMYMPDFLYKPQKKINGKKFNRAICTGTINNTQKDILGLIDVFREFDYPLLIAGVFTDDSIYSKVCEIKSDNITIINRALSEDEYMKLISESMFSIIPYKMSVYKNATSGVLRESLYLGVKVIAPQQMLKNMNIDAEGYSSISQIPYLIQNNANLPDYKDIDHKENSEIAKEIDKYLKHNCV